MSIDCCACGNPASFPRYVAGPPCTKTHPRKRAPHPSGYQLAKAKNAKLIALINAISDRLDKAGPWPECGEQVVHIRALIAEWRANG